MPGLFAILGFMLTAVVLPYEAAAQNVLVLENDDVSTGRGAAIAAKTIAAVTSEGPTAFSARTDFSSFDVVFFGCTTGSAALTAAANNAAFQATAAAGRVVVTGAHADDHSNLGAGVFLDNAFAWISGCSKPGVLAICNFPSYTWSQTSYLQGWRRSNGSM